MSADRILDATDPALPLSENLPLFSDDVEPSTSVRHPVAALDPLAFPLFGSRLIEASAGTGKTFAIAALYLRLVLGHGGNGQAFAEPLLPPQILVVTFTDAATRELRARIHERLMQAARHFRATASEAPDPVLHGILEAYPTPAERAACARRLEVAAEWMDEAAVSTIHAWCYRMLREHAFDSGSLFEQELAADQQALRAEAVRDYWRHMVYPQQGARLELLCTTLGRDPETLGRRVWGLLSSEPARMASLDELTAVLDDRLAALEPFKAPWRDDFAAIAASFLSALPALNGNKYRKAEALLETMRLWALDPGRTEPGAASKELTVRFSRAGMNERLKKGRVLPADLHPAFAMMDGYAELTDDTPALLLRHAAGWIRARFEREQRRQAQLGFDDLLTRLDDALASPGGARLAHTIRTQFPIAMIDEFQDTDPVQYRIFERIYRIAENRPEQGLFLIGDPKQSIYSFRGADIHSYLQARRATDGRHYTLGTNYRSTEAMVQAANRLFEHAEGYAAGAFLFRAGDDDPVPFQGVTAQGRAERLEAGGEPLPALVLVHPEAGDSVSTGEYLGTMAQSCATEMVTLLEGARAGHTGFAQVEGFAALQPSDLAVLVRNRREADAIQAALRARGVRSVYLSDRESVFASPEAADVLRWLRACAEPQSERLLRAALATATLNLDLQALDRLNTDEAHWEQRVVEFRDYRRIWRRQGVLPMLRRFLHAFGLPQTLFQRADGERVLTNLLHLSELLQTAAAELDGEPALIRHLATHLQGDGAASDEQILRLESDEGLVRIVTIHKAKGLQYPLVFLPFIGSFRLRDDSQLPLIYRDAAGRVCRSMTPDALALAQADRERLAEDLRLLYVAVTRACHFCWLGIAPLRRGTRKENELHHSAIGYLLGGGDPIPGPALAEALRGLAGTVPAIVVSTAPEPKSARYGGGEAPAALGAPRRMMHTVREHWWIASYSALRLAGWSEHVAATGPEAPDTALEDRLGEAGDEPVATIPTPRAPEAGGLHRFPRGPAPGTFLHGLLEWAAREGFAAVAADPARLRDTVARRCRLRGWQTWVEPLCTWFGRLLVEPLTLPGAGVLRLDRLRTYQPELEFWFETHWIDSRRLDAAVRSGTLQAAARPELMPQLLNGMLKGFIDLVFEHEGRYYTLDYKSNWLGPRPEDYVPERMRARVLESRYDLQYVLYTLALHRLLKSRQPDYAYDRHMGGAITWFLRGLDAGSQGLHLERVPEALIEELDQMIRSAPDAIDRRNDARGMPEADAGEEHQTRYQETGRHEPDSHESGRHESGRHESDDHGADCHRAVDQGAGPEGRR